MSESKFGPAWRLAPLAVFLLLAAIFVLRLFGGDASRLPSALIGRPAPAFSLPAIEGMNETSGLSDVDLRQGHVSLLNVFASWCGPCHVEHETLMAISRDETLTAEGVRLYGLAYKDEHANARKFLSDNGDPYAAVGADLAGRVGIDFGVYGVPETFVVTGDGTIFYKFVGPLTPETFKNALLPEIEKARAAKGNDVAK